MPVPQELREKAFEALYHAGWCDEPIARVLHAAPTTIRQWRESRLLPKNLAAHVKIDEAVARRMYDDGESDYAIARALGMHQSSIVGWRRRNGLPSKRPCHRLTPEDIRKARKMLKLGASMRQVAREIDNCNVGALQYLRQKINHPGLRRHGITNTMIRDKVLKDPTIQRRIERAIGPKVPADIRLDAVSELYADVLEGRVAAEYIEQQAPAYRSRAYDMCGSKYGARSLDDELAENFTLGDTIEDSSALEEMEVAAEAAYGNDNW